MFYRLVLAFLSLIPSSLALASQGEVAVLLPTVTNVLPLATRAQDQPIPQVVRPRPVSLKTVTTIALSLVNRRLFQYDINRLLDFLSGVSEKDMRSWQVIVTIARLNNADLMRRALAIIKPNTGMQYREAITRIMAREWYEAFEALFSYYVKEQRGNDAEFRFLALLASAIQGNSRGIKREIEWQKAAGRDLNRTAKQALYARRFHPDEELVPNEGCGTLCLLSHGPKFMQSKPLHAAVSACHSSLITYLLQQGFDPDLPDHEGHTAEQIARIWRCWLEKNPPASGDRERLSAYKKHMEIRKQTERMLKLFRKYSSKALGTGCPEVIWQINQIGQKSHEGTEVDRAQVIAAVALKLCPGLASAFIKDRQGNTVLHAAVLADNAYIVELILVLNPEILHLKNEAGTTAFALALSQQKWSALVGFAQASRAQHAVEQIADQSNESHVETDATDCSFMLQQAIAANSAEAVQALLVTNPDLFELIPLAPQFSNKLYLRILSLISNRHTALEGVVKASYIRQKMKNLASIEERETVSTGSSLYQIMSAIFALGGELLFFLR